MRLSGYGGGEGAILNSRSEYSRCRITRLTLEKGDENEKGVGGVTKEQVDGAEEEWGELTEWSRGLIEKRREVDKIGRRALGAPERTTSKKRGELLGKGGIGNKRRVKKLKYNIISEEWGEEGVYESKTQFLYSGLEGVGPKVRGEGRKRKKEIKKK